MPWVGEAGILPKPSHGRRRIPVDFIHWPSCGSGCSTFWSTSHEDTSDIIVTFIKLEALIKLDNK